MNSNVLLVVQSYPALRILYHLIAKGFNVEVLSTNKTVIKYCKYYDITVKDMNLKIIENTFLKNYKIKYIINYLIVKYIISTYINKKNFSLVFTILGLDLKLLPAILSLKYKIYFWDDSNCVKRLRINNLNIRDQLFLTFFNFITKNKFYYYSDTTFAKFMCVDIEKLNKNIEILPNNYVKNIIPNQLLRKNKKNYKIILLGDYSLYAMSLKVNIIKLLNLIEEINSTFKNCLYYKPHPGSNSIIGLEIFEGRVIDDFIPIESIIDSVNCVLCIGSTASIMDIYSNKLLGLGYIIDLRPELINLSKAQGLTHISNKASLINQIQKMLI